MWWVGSDLHVECEGGQVEIFQNAHVTRQKTEFHADSGIEVTEVVLYEEGTLKDLLGKEA